MAGFKLINGIYTIDKSVQSQLDYGVRMYRWLVPGDLIDTSIAPDWEISAGLTIVAEGVSADKQTAFVMLSGGVLHDLEWASCTWHTIQNRIEIQTLYFSMVPK